MQEKLHQSKTKHLEDDLAQGEQVQS